MRKVIVNSTPLIALCKAGELLLLKRMYEEITIPEAVYSEIISKSDIVAKAVRENEDWIKILSVEDKSNRKMYKAKLHDGEVEVMMLAQEIKADVVIIDDYAARKTAEYLGLPLTGTLGVLIKAKRNGFIQKIMPIIDKLTMNGIYLSEDLKQQVRNLVGE